MKELGFVVIERNQASGWPRVCDDEIMDFDDAMEAVVRWQEDNKPRHERYSVARIVELVNE